VDSQNEKRVGILGSGQLSQMMVQSSRKIASDSPIQMRVLAGSSTDSAAKEPGTEVIFGKVSEVGTLKRFLSGLNVVVFESELVDIPALRSVLKDPELREVRCIPDLSVMELLSEKLEQKKLMTRLGIATAPFEEGPALSCSGEDDTKAARATLASWFDHLRERWGGFVLKWSKYGYDGRGVLLVRGAEDTDAALESALAASRRGTRVYAETWVPFVRELAIVAAHSVDGELRAFPLVVSEQRGGACHWVTGPAIHPVFEAQARSYTETLAKSIGLHGAFAIEMFETDRGELWVNEIAPRVHNSGHYTQEASNHDQFEMHLRAVLGKQFLKSSLPELKSSQSFAMLNLLGPDDIRGRFVGLDAMLPKPPAGIVLHWYGKEEVFPGRKLGHLNAVAKSSAELQTRILQLREYEEEWTRFLKGLKT
jgi:5-(carboxyamino)imidazole ribonucleotide synthase